MNLDTEIIKQITDIASKFNHIEKIILFGSRVRGDNRERSDIDFKKEVETEGAIIYEKFNI